MLVIVVYLILVVLFYISIYKMATTENGEGENS